MTITLHEATAIANRCDTVQELNLIIKAWNAKRAAEVRKVAQNFSEGDKVWFKTKRGIVVHGTVTKINVKTIVVAPSDGTLGEWKVGPTLLHKEN